LVRPAVEAGERLGFLPGDLRAKLNPYLRPLMDALGEMVDFNQARNLMEQDLIEVIPLAYMRGRTLNDAFIILDEAQNTTIAQMKMFLTRMGERSKMVVSGDVTQQDLPRGVTSGLRDALRRLANVDDIGIVRLEATDIVRHRLVQKIVEAYEDVDRNDSDSNHWKHEEH
jgi:phosphate starvation-inducible protein PhoH and related proteins